MRYFLGIVGIQRFSDFSLSSQYSDTLILFSMFLIIVEIFSFICGCKHKWPNHVKTSRAFLL